MVTEEMRAAMYQAANHLHHLSMRYSGAVVELARGGKVGLLPKGLPGLSEVRDLIDLVLLCRAELNGLTKLLTKAGVFTEEELVKQITEEYTWLTQQKADSLGLEVVEGGLVIRKG